MIYLCIFLFKGVSYFYCFYCLIIKKFNDKEFNNELLECKIKSYGRGGIRTHASEETGALNQRLRPLGHPTTGYQLSLYFSTYF